MLKTVELINKLGEEYGEMLRHVNIPDFYKCIAQYSGISIKDLQDEVIEDYLTCWAINKKYIFDFFGGKTQVDLKISYIDETKDYFDIYKELARKYPAYYHWLNGIKGSSENKLLEKNVDYDQCCAIKKCFPDYKWTGEAITHFFKNKLNAPDNLITDIGRIYENDKIHANFTLSIDPVDIMLSSENPYNWQSCYRLEENCESHSDGCLAGVIDHPTIVTYIWTEEGKYNLYEKYELKKIRYKRMRMTIGINRKFNAIHFNAIYPGKSNLSENFQKTLRDIVETYFAKQLNKPNIWRKNKTDYKDREERIECCREHYEYGYGEYHNANVYYLVDEENNLNIKETHPDIYVYDQIIYCPCGCGNVFIGSDCGDDYLEYNGEGQINDNYIEEDEGIWCDELDEYAECDGDCYHCEIFNSNRAVCEITGEECNSYHPLHLQDKGMIDLRNEHIVHCDAYYCKDCPYYKEHCYKGPTPEGPSEISEW